MQPGDCPVRGCRSRTGDLQQWMMSYNPVQYRLLIRLDIHEEDMFSLGHDLFKTAEVSVRHLYAKEAAFPDAKTEYNKGKKYKRHPAGSGFGPAQPIGSAKNQCRERYSNQRTNFPGMDDILLH